MWRRLRPGGHSSFSMCVCASYEDDHVLLYGHAVPRAMVSRQRIRCSQQTSYGGRCMRAMSRPLSQTGLSLTGRFLALLLGASAPNAPSHCIIGSKPSVWMAVTTPQLHLSKGSPQVHTCFLVYLFTAALTPPPLHSSPSRPMTMSSCTLALSHSHPPRNTLRPQPPSYHAQTMTVGVFAQRATRNSTRYGIDDHARTAHHSVFSNVV
jgi:hypothetical protein